MLKPKKLQLFASPSTPSLPSSPLSHYLPELLQFLIFRGLGREWIKLIGFTYENKGEISAVTRKIIAQIRLAATWTIYFMFYYIANSRNGYFDSTFTFTCFSFWIAVCNWRRQYRHRRFMRRERFSRINQQRVVAGKRATLSCLTSLCSGLRTIAPEIDALMFAWC